MAAKAALYLAMREAKISNVKLAKQLGCDEKDVRRLLDPRHSSRITTLQAALAALGKRIVSAVENAA
jgi:antitoxin HicB